MDAGAHRSDGGVRSPLRYGRGWSIFHFDFLKFFWVDFLIFSVKEAMTNKEWLEENGPCVTCGSWENLQIDHIDPKTKLERPARLKYRSPRFREAELAKCQALCERCHIEKSAVDRGYPLIPDSTIREIRDLQKQGWGRNRLEKKFGLSEDRIRAIMKNERYKWVT